MPHSLSILVKLELLKYSIYIYFLNFIRETFSANNENYVFEAPSNKLRLEWLSALQTSRKLYYDRNLDTPNVFFISKHYTKQ